MRDTVHRGWQHWRIALMPEDVVTVSAPRFTRVPLAEEPAADGIRHELVARVRLAIEAGVYDSDDIWDAAEEKLLRDAERGV